MPIKLSFKDIIFVMEDVDAASPIVHSRSGDKSGDSTTKVILEKAGGDHGPEKVELTKQVSTSAAETSSAGVGGDMVDLGEGGDAGLMMAMLSSVMDSGSGDKKGLVRFCLVYICHFNCVYDRTTSQASTCPSTTSWICLAFSMFSMEWWTAPTEF